VIQYKYQLNTVTKCLRKTIIINEEREKRNYHLTLDDRIIIEKMIQEWKDAADTKIYSKKFTKNTSFVFA
jgi:hypothetical protein